MSVDRIVPFAFEALPVRGALIHLSRSWRRMQRDHNYDDLVRDTLGHAAAATGLIAQSLKFDGSITLQIQGAGVLQMLVMQCTSNLEMRGMATTHEDRSATDFSALTAGAHCAITVDAGERPYQGIVAIDGSSLSDSLAHYFERSVQIPTHVALLANENIVGGLLLQQMPGQPIDDDDWNRLGFLAATLSARDFNTSDDLELIGKLFAEDDVRVHDARRVRFRCRCSDRKVEDVLRMIGEDEARAAIAELGEIEVICEYCGEKRAFDPVDVSRIFAANAIDGPDSVQ